MKKLYILETINVIFAILGTFLFHFMYDWFGEPKFLAWLFAINESVFEHIKIVFMPLVLFAVVEFFILKPESKLNYFAIKSISLISSPVIMLVLYYLYTGIIGYNILGIDISIALISVISASLISFKLLKDDRIIKNPFIYISIFIAMFVSVIALTYFPPEIPLFIEP